MLPHFPQRLGQYLLENASVPRINAKSQFSSTRHINIPVSDRTLSVESFNCPTPLPDSSTQMELHLYTGRIIVRQTGEQHISRSSAEGDAINKGARAYSGRHSGSIVLSLETESPLHKTEDRLACAVHANGPPCLAKCCEEMRS